MRFEHFSLLYYSTGVQRVPLTVHFGIKCLLSNLGANCLLPLQKENSGVINFQLAVVCKRPVSPQIGHQPPNLRIYTLLLPLVIWYIVSYGEKTTERPTDDVGPSGDCLPHVEFRNPVVSEGVD